MDHEAAAEVISKLETAIDGVLEATATIAQSSRQQFEAHREILAPARLGIYLTLQDLYASYRDLAPDDAETDQELVSLGVAVQERPLDEPGHLLRQS